MLQLTTTVHSWMVNANGEQIGHVFVSMVSRNFVFVMFVVHVMMMVVMVMLVHASFTVFTLTVTMSSVVLDKSKKKKVRKN